MRAITSVPPPGANGTTARTGLLGQGACALAAAQPMQLTKAMMRFNMAYTTAGMTSLAKRSIERSTRF